MDFAKPIKAISLPQDVPSTSDRHLIKVENQVQHLMEAHLAPKQPSQVNKTTSSWKPTFNLAHTQTFTIPQNSSLSTDSSSYQMKIEKALINFDSYQERRLSSLGTQIGQQQDDMISKINLLWKTISEKLDDTPTRNTEYEDKEEGSVKSSATEYKDHEITVKSVEEFKEETKEEEKDNPEHFDAFPTMKELRYHEWLLKNPRPPWVKAKIRIGNLNNVKISCMIGYFDKKQAYLDVESPVNVMSRLHYNWIMINRKFTYECDFMVLEDTTSVIDHDLGSVVFGKPFMETTRLVYDMKEGTVVFEKDKEKIMFKMPHKMEMFKHIYFTDIKTDRIPPFVIESDDDNSEKTHYSDSLDLGPKYKYDENLCRAIQSLLTMKARRNKGKVT
ncbi:hypothetical protein Tco_0789554 [Tanacetum coccineum]